VLALPDAFNPAAKHPSARLGDDRIMIRPHSMLSIFVLLQSHIDFLCGYESTSICLPHNRRRQDTKTEARFFMGGPSRAVPLNLTLCVFFKLSGARLSGIVAWW